MNAEHCSPNFNNYSQQLSLFLYIYFFLHFYIWYIFPKVNTN